MQCLTPGRGDSAAGSGTPSDLDNMDIDPKTAAVWAIAEPIHRKCWANFKHIGAYDGRASVSWMAISSMFWLKRAIQAVPSACSR